MGMGDDYSEYLRQEGIKQAERDRVARAYAEESARRAEDARQSVRREEMDRAAKADAKSGRYNHVYSDDGYYQQKRAEANGGWDSYPNRTAREESEKAKQRDAASRTPSSGASTSRPNFTVPRPPQRPITPRRPPTRGERITGRIFLLSLVGGAVGGVGWLAPQLYRGYQRSQGDEMVSRQSIIAARLALGDRKLRAAAAPFSSEQERFVAAVQYNLKHMPVDQGQTLNRIEPNWKYWGPIDGKWSSMDAAMVNMCGGRLTNKFGVPSGLTLSPEVACAGDLNSDPPTHLERLVVYTTELRRILTTSHCNSGAGRWQNCAGSKRTRRHHRRHKG